jgi:WD40 repeat protein
VLDRELVAARDDGVIQVWGRRDGKLLGETEREPPVVALAEAESSSGFLAALDRRGAVSLVDVTDPGRPRVLPLRARLASGERPLAVAFSDQSNEVVAVGARGEILRVETTGAISSRSSIWSFRGDLPWGRDAAGSTLGAARFLPDNYEDEEGLLVSTADGAVADLDLAKDQGKTALRAGVANGRVLSLDRVPYGEPQLAVGTSEGLVLLGEESYEDEPVSYPGPAVRAVSIEEESLRQGGREGLMLGSAYERPLSGPPVLRFDAGVDGVAVIHPEGKVSPLGPSGVGISMAETGITPVATFDPRGRVLVTEGYDANHVEKLQAVRPQLRDPEEEYPEDEVVETYRPDPDWWPEAEDPEALYVNDVAADDRYVVAGGEDPEGNATVLVWDTESGEPLRHLTLSTGGLTTELPSVVGEVLLLPEQHKIACYSTAQELVAIWSTDTWELVDSIPVGAAGDISASPDGSTIVAVGLDPGSDGYVGSEDPTPLTFVDVEEGEVRDEVSLKGVSDVSFSPDGSTLAMVDQSGFLRLRSADGRELDGPLVKVGAAAETLAWRPDGKLIAVSLGQGEIVLVDPESGEVSEPLPRESEVPSPQLSWSSDGGMLAAPNPEWEEEGEGYDPGPASIWTLAAADLERRMCELGGCGSAANTSPQGSQLGDASALAAVELVFREEGSLIAADLEGKTARIGYLNDEYPTPPISYDWGDAGFAWSAAGQIGVLLAGREKPLFWPCGCSGVSWDGDEVVSLATDGRWLIRIDPERGSLRTVPTRGVPPYLPGLLGVVGETPIVAAFEKEPDRSTPSALFEIRAGGRARKLIGDAHGSIFLRWPSSSRDSLAFLAGLSSGACYSTNNVGVVTAGAAGKLKFDFPPSPFGEEPTVVRSLQVAADGTVGAAIGPVGCDERGYPEDEPPSAERYLLRDGQWEPTGVKGYDVQAAGGTILVEETEDWAESGALFAVRGEDREELASDVTGPVGRP